MSDALGLNEIGTVDNEQEKEPQGFEKGSVMSLTDLGRPSTLNWKESNIGRRYRWISRSCRSLQIAGPPPQPISHPFSGTLTSQLRCTECGHKVICFFKKLIKL